MQKGEHKVVWQMNREKKHFNVVESVSIVNFPTDEI